MHERTAFCTKGRFSFRDRKIFDLIDRKAGIHGKVEAALLGRKFRRRDGQGFYHPRVRLRDWGGRGFCRGMQDCRWRRRRRWQGRGWERRWPQGHTSRQPQQNATKIEIAPERVSPVHRESSSQLSLFAHGPSAWAPGHLHSPKKKIIFGCGGEVAATKNLSPEVGSGDFSAHARKKAKLQAHLVRSFRPFPHAWERPGDADGSGLRGRWAIPGERDGTLYVPMIRRRLSPNGGYAMPFSVMMPVM